MNFPKKLTTRYLLIQTKPVYTITQITSTSLFISLLKTCLTTPQSLSATARPKVTSIAAELLTALRLVPNYATR